MALEMQSRQLSKTRGAAPTQKFLNIAEIKQNTIVMKDGSLRAILAVSSTNFALKSEEEQNALIVSYQSFLNSLNFPVQILIRSRIMDISGYLDKLRALMAGQTNELLRIQMSEYIEYVAQLVEYASIMSKTFYVVVPYSVEPVKQTLVSRFMKFFNPAGAIISNEADFMRAKTELERRISHAAAGLGGIGLRSISLRTDELVELLYASYNFETASVLHADAIADMQVSQ